MDFLSAFSFQVLNGLIWGLVVALLAVGLNLIYGLLGVINVAQGAFYMLGAVVCWYVWYQTGSYLVALVVAAVSIGLLGIATEKWLLRPIEAHPELTIILTIGLAYVLEQAALATFGGDIRAVQGLIDLQVPVFGRTYPGYRLAVAGVAVVVLVGLWIFLQRTRYGLWIRAVKHDPLMSRALGVPTGRVYAFTMGIGTGLAALGGALAAPIVSVRVEMGFDILVTVFIVVILGGLGNLAGSVVIAIAMTTIEGVTTIFTTPTNARVLSLATLIAVVLLRPEGVFAGREA